MILKNIRYYLLSALTYLLIQPCIGQISLPQMVRDSMVLQRNATINIWGWASPKEKIKLVFQQKKYQTITGDDGKWLIKLSPMQAGGPYSMDISGKNKITLKEILIGDVWFCSGQSNMVHQLNIHDITYAQEIANANNSRIRQFWVPTLTSLEGPKENFPSGFWKSAVGEDIRPFSAVAYFFAKKIQDKYQVPIGIINSSVGGTPIEAWTSEDGFKEFPQLEKTIQRNKDTSYLKSIKASTPNGMARVNAKVQDKGLLESPKWFEPNYSPKGWHNINVPGYWEDQGIKDLNGTVWYRKEIHIPASILGKPGKVFLGRIVDSDILYINGKQVGNTTYMYPQRRYPIASDLLKEGKNILVIKVTNNAGKGGFITDKPYSLIIGSDTIDLKGTWQYKVGEVFNPIPRSAVLGGGGINPQNQPAALYNAMISPAINYTIKGILWYQGESNAGRASDYAKLQPAQIMDWRNKWQLGDIPFVFVQLPNFMDANYVPSESQWAELRESQFKSLAVKNTAMAVAIDLGEWNDIHPDNKKDVGERLALAAEKLAYDTNIVHSGPLFKSSTIEGNKIILSFDHIGSGLVTNDGEEPKEFAIAGADKKFVWAKTKIENNRVIVWSDELAKPAFVRYAWADNPVYPNLYNREGLPASPFRTDK